MFFQCQWVKKGFGMLSMILWAVVYSYKHLREKLGSGSGAQRGFPQAGLWDKRVAFPELTSGKSQR